MRELDNGENCFDSLYEPSHVGEYNKKVQSNVK